MQTNKQRKRRAYVPLTTSISYEVDTPGSPLMQVYDAAANEFSPDRAYTPCIVRPVVDLKSADGNAAYNNSNLSNDSLQWYIDGVLLSTVWTAGTDYTIDTTASENRGRLVIYKNIPVGETHELVFKGVVNDSRTGYNVSVSTPSFNISTIDKSLDQWEVALLCPSIRNYDPIRDNLLLYDYKVAQGIISASAAAEEAANDETAYLYKVGLEARQGSVYQSIGYGLILYRISNGSLVQVASIDPTTGNLTCDDDNEVVSMTRSQIVLDMRLIDYENYVLAVTVDNEGTAVEATRGQFAVSRYYGVIRLNSVNGTGVAPNEAIRRDYVQAWYDGNVLDYPECAIRIVWMTEDANGNETEHNEGDKTEYVLADAGMGDSVSSTLSQWLNYEQKESYGIALDDDNETIFTDEDGVPYIFN